MGSPRGHPICRMSQKRRGFTIDLSNTGLSVFLSFHQIFWMSDQAKKKNLQIGIFELVFYFIFSTAENLHSYSSAFTKHPFLFHGICFRFVPSQYRVIYVSCAAFVWTNFLCYLRDTYGEDHADGQVWYLRWHSLTGIYWSFTSST